MHMMNRELIMGRKTGPMVIDGWLHGTAVERYSLTGKLSLSLTLSDP